ncbi:hypothetical protein [Nannocystis pusilla]|uniref:hypothetical protein n=1 Tax=Nannocystis pusilla TaxID=889268 RepID=UPI003B80187A
MEAMKPELQLLGLHDIGQVDNLIVANRRMLHPFLAGRPANSDAMPLLDTGAEKARFLKESAGFLHRIRWTPRRCSRCSAASSAGPTRPGASATAATRTCSKRPRPRPRCCASTPTRPCASPRTSASRP